MFSKSVHSNLVLLPSHCNAHTLSLTSTCQIFMMIPAASLILSWTVTTLHWCICLLHDCMWLLLSYILPFFNSFLCSCDLCQLLGFFSPYDTFLISQSPLKIHDWMNCFRKVFIYGQLMTASEVSNISFFFLINTTYTLIFIDL